MSMRARLDGCVTLSATTSAWRRALVSARGSCTRPTGQAYKGGPNTGVFLQITCDDPFDFPVPGEMLSFGAVKAAQARGDLQVLAERKRRALRVHLGSNVEAGLATLWSVLQQALR